VGECFFWYQLTEVVVVVVLLTRHIEYITRHMNAFTCCCLCFVALVSVRDFATLYLLHFDAGLTA